MKWFLQYFLSPILAAVLAIAGNYYLVGKPDIQKEYTKLGVDIVMKKDSPMFMRKYGYALINDNSPVNLSEPARQERLESLMKNIPVDLDPVDHMTMDEAAARLIVLTKWAAEVRAVCDGCVNKKLFQKQYESVLLKIRGH